MPGREELRDEHLDYGSLLPFVDVVTAAVYGYGAYEIANAFAPVLKDPPATPEWARILLLLFVAYYLTADSIEARLYNELFRYTGRRRFLLDILIAACFFLAFMAAAAQSSVVLLALAAVFLGGAIWSVFLELEIRQSVRWAWPRLIIFSHTGAAVACGYGYDWLYVRGIHRLDVRMSAAVWGLYSMLAISMALVRRLFQIPAADADLLPVGVVASLVSRICRVCIVSCTRAFRFMRGDLNT